MLAVDPQADAQSGADGADLDFRLLDHAGKGEQIKERNAEQQQRADHHALVFRQQILAVLEEVDGAADQRDRHSEAEPDALLLANLHELPEHQAEDDPTAESVDQLLRVAVVAQGEGTAGQAEDDAGVNQARVLQEQEQQEGEQTAVDAVALAQLADRRHAEEQYQAPEGPQGDVADVPPPGRPVQLHAHEQEQAQVDALQDELSLLPTHDALVLIVYVVALLLWHGLLTVPLC